MSGDKHNKGIAIYADEFEVGIGKTVRKYRDGKIVGERGRDWHIGETITDEQFNRINVNNKDYLDTKMNGEK